MGLEPVAEVKVGMDAPKDASWWKWLNRIGSAGAALVTAAMILFADQPNAIKVLSVIATFLAGLGFQHKKA